MQIQPALIFEVLEEFDCNNGFIWWLVDFNGLEGWLAEGTPDDYFLEPLPEPDELDEDACIVIADGIVNQRSGPGTSFSQVSQLSPGQRVEVIGQTRSTAGFIWWELVDETWVREDTVFLEGICSDVPESR